jgi:hypothetical protein
MSPEHYYYVTPAGSSRQQVEAWSGYPLQFAGQRRFGWQDDMAADLRAALGQLAITPGEALAGMYLSTDESRCDVENRLFTNPGSSCFPSGKVSAIRFERGTGPPPAPPVPVARTAGHLYYYRYQVGGIWQWWEPGDVLARWRRVPRRIRDDGSARPVWHAMKQAVASGQVQARATALDASTPFGIRIAVHATARGPRSAPAISESLIDGIVAAFHDGDPSTPAAAALLATRLPGTSPQELEALAKTGSAGALFGGSAFVVQGPYLQISPCDERCYAGDVAISADAVGQYPEISGELFTLRRVGA